MAEIQTKTTDPVTEIQNETTSCLVTETKSEPITISDWIREEDVNPELESKTDLIYTWDGRFNKNCLPEGDPLPEGRGILRCNGNMVYAGIMKNGIPHDEKAWALVQDISDKYPGQVGFVGTFVNGHPYGPCNIYPEVNNPESIVRGRMIGGKFVEPVYPGSNFYFSEVVEIP